MIDRVDMPNPDSRLVEFMARPLTGGVGTRLLGLAQGGPGSDSPEAKLVAAREFASLLFSQMLKQMRKSMRLGKSLLDGGHEQRMYEDMLDDELARQMARSGQTGLVRTIYEDLVKMDVKKSEHPADVFHNDTTGDN